MPTRKRLALCRGLTVLDITRTLHDLVIGIDPAIFCGSETTSTNARKCITWIYKSNDTTQKQKQKRVDISLDALHMHLFNIKEIRREL